MSNRPVLPRFFPGTQALAGVFVLAILAACGDQSSAPPVPASGMAASPPSTKADPGGKADAEARAKLNAYVEAYNKLVGTSGLTETRALYDRLRGNLANPRGSMSFAPGWVGLSLPMFRKARALPDSGQPKLDAAADALLPDLTRLTQLLAELDTYYKSGAYREDAMARGRTQDPVLLGLFDTVSKQADAFDTQLTAVQAIEQQRRLALLKSDGKMFSYRSSLALSQGQTIVDRFGDAGDLKAEKAYASADVALASMEQTLSDQRQALDKAEAESTPGKAPPQALHRSVVTSLTTLAGHYRELKRSRSAADANRMFNAYNGAVQTSNHLRMAD